MPSDTAWLMCISTAARPSVMSSTRVTLHSGREMSSGACTINSAMSRTSRSVPGVVTRARRMWKSRLKSGSTTQRGAIVGSVGTTTFWRIRGMRREALSNRSRKRFQSGVDCRI